MANTTATRIRVEPLTCSIGAEINGVQLGDASRSDDLFAEIRALLLQHKVLFLRDQHVTRVNGCQKARKSGGNGCWL